MELMSPSTLERYYMEITKRRVDIGFPSLNPLVDLKYPFIEPLIIMENLGVITPSIIITMNSVRKPR